MTTRVDAEAMVVVGAGLAGLMCARTLHEQGLPVVVLDKARGPGGRTATRREGDLRWDHGAPTLDLSLSDALLGPFVAAWRDQGVIVAHAPRTRTWDGILGEPVDGPTQWTATEGANRLARHLASGLELRTGTAVASIDREDGRWQLRDPDGERIVAAAQVVLAVPAPQAAGLLGGVAPSWAARLASVRYAPRLTALLDGPGVDVDAEVVSFMGHPVLAEARRQDVGPGRRGPPRWVVHAPRAWSLAHLEDDRDGVGAALGRAFCEALALPLPVRATGHRWRFAQVDEALGQDVLATSAADLVVCGDGVAGGGASGALRSGLAAARVVGRS